MVYGNQRVVTAKFGAENGVFFVFFQLLSGVFRFRALVGE
jgi:hypothetical protein